MSGVQQSPQGDAKPTGVSRVQSYFSELRSELRKVTFPTTKELIQSTIVVFVFTMTMMAVIALFDAIVSKIFITFILPPAS
jgi:preprotein translocase subunit SecE